MRVLVTGATGFVGSWLTRELVKQGFSVRILRRRSSDLSELKDLDLEHAEGDVTDNESLQRATAGCEIVFHLAGVVAYTRSMRAAMDSVNIGGTANVIQACLDKKVRRLIYCSSVVAVGASFTPGVLDENSLYNLAHLDLGYFESKRAAEILVMNAVKEKGLDAVVLNPSTIYGAGDAKKGSRKVQLKVARGAFRFYTSGGVSVVAVEDVVSATIKAVESGVKGERYILSGDNITIKQCFELIAEAAKVKPPSVYLPNSVVHMIGKVGDQLESFGRKGLLNSENAWSSLLFHWFDCSKAQKQLGYKPRSARQAIANSVEWSRSHGLI